MCEQNESYEELTQKLKPFSVVLHRISAEQYVKLKVVDDPKLIRDEPLPEVCYGNDVNDEEETIEEEIEVVLAEVDTNYQNNGSNDDTKEFSCFICRKKCLGYTESFTHFQLHIDYFPIQCSVCDEANTDLISFVRHCRKCHPELEKAKYIKKFNSNCFEWIQNLLATEPNNSFNDNPQKYCPACSWVHLSDPNAINPNEPTLKPNQILRHIHEHILYMPFGCNVCKENGNEFRIHVLDTTPRKHFTNEHKHLLNESPFWKFFNKKYTIPALDKFISNYLGIFGIKVPKKRNKKKKSKAEKQIVKIPNGVKTPVVNGQKKVVPVKPVVKQVVTLQDVLIPTNQPILSTTNSNSVISYSNVIKLNEMDSPLLIFPSNNKINMGPIPVESTDIGIVCIDPRMVSIDDRLFQYICVFCDSEKFLTKIEASIHYSIHFNYNPVVCMLCQQKFIDLSLLIYHYNKDHSEYKNNLFHYLEENEKIEKWINGFLDFQKTHEFKAHVSVLYGDFCFICDKLSKQENGLKMNSEKNNVNAIRDHIHHHLHYFPYKCLVCFHGGRDVRFASLNTSAFEHMLKIHGISPNTTELRKNFLKLFVKSDEVLDLEKFIDSKIFPKRQQISETPLSINLKRKLEQIEADNKKRIQFTPHPVHNISPLKTQLAAKPTPIRNPENNRTYTLSPVKNLNTILVSNSIRTPNLNYTRIANSNSTLMLNGINSNRLIAPKITPLKSTEFIPSKNTYMDPFLLCFHCHTKVANTAQLESHHQNKHPKLTIASYAPTKRDLLALK